MSDTATIDQTDLIAAAIARHGPRKVILAALRTLMRPRAANAAGIGVPANAHLRRDVGLAPEQPPPTWELMR